MQCFPVHLLHSRSQDTCKLILGIVCIHLIVVGRNDGDILYSRVLNGLQKAQWTWHTISRGFPPCSLCSCATHAQSVYGLSREIEESTHELKDGTACIGGRRAMLGSSGVGLPWGPGVWGPLPQAALL